MVLQRLEHTSALAVVVIFNLAAPVREPLLQDVDSEALAFLTTRYALINLKGKVSVVDMRNVAARRQKGHEKFELAD